MWAKVYRHSVNTRINRISPFGNHMEPLPYYTCNSSLLSVSALTTPAPSWSSGHTWTAPEVMLTPAPERCVTPPSTSIAFYSVYHLTKRRVKPGEHKTSSTTTTTTTAAAATATVPKTSAGGAPWRGALCRSRGARSPCGA